MDLDVRILAVISKRGNQMINITLRDYLRNIEFLIKYLGVMKDILKKSSL
jgi:hypothetical protein